MNDSQQASVHSSSSAPAFEQLCDLCGLPLRYGNVPLSMDKRTLLFCCQGCKMVYTMLLEATGTNDPEAFKESELYRQCVAAGVIPSSEEDLIRIHEKEGESTASTFALEEKAELAHTLGLDLKIEGMWCTACAWVIEKTASQLPGMQSAVCSFSTDRLRCRYRPERIAPDQIAAAVSRLGYECRETHKGTAEQKTRRRELIRLVITGLLSANVMMLSWALYAGFFTELSPDAVSKISLPIVVMASVVMIYGGGPMLRKAWHGLIHCMPGMETLVGIAAGCAFTYSIYNWINGSIHLYFDTACMLMTLVLLGKFLERQAKNRVGRDLDTFFELQPAKVRLVTDDAPRGRYVAIEQLAPGDRFAVEEEETVPADGRIHSGNAFIDESTLTGEPKSVAVVPGDFIKSGTRLVKGQVIATAEQVGADTMLGQMIRIMTRSLEQKSDIEEKSDRTLRWFVPGIVAIAIGTGLFCILRGLSFNESMVRSVTVMVISCPCALGVAIPIARLAGISLAGRKGILVREIEAFEQAVMVDTIVFDKTGTLTRGRWQLNRVVCEPGMDEKCVIGWASGLEHASDHEIARSIKAYAKQKRIAPVQPDEVIDFPDGIEGQVDGKTIRIGSRGFSIKQTKDEESVGEAKTEGMTSHVFLSVDGALAAELVFGDAIRPSVQAMVKALQSDAYGLQLISGDGQDATRTVGKAVNILQSKGNLLPAEKAAFIDRLASGGYRSAMVGDGINDAAALARADLGVAVYSGTGLAKEAAHITLMRGDPAQLLDFFPLARKVNRKVTQNLWCAWLYNLISLPIAMSGLLTPLVAATAMLFSSLTVIGNTLLLFQGKPNRV
jgi:heavy metal translocating P-type ATPase